MNLKGKKILLGVTGSISAYKMPEFVRVLKKSGAELQVMMSKSAGHFVSKMVLEVLSGNQVLTGMFGEGQAMPHIKSSRSADAVVIAPATANTLAKLAHGYADDLISAAVLGADCPVLIAPAMNVKMWNNPIVRENAAKLESAGYEIVGPECGDLACGETGEGRLVNFEVLADAIKRALTPGDLAGKKIMITAGPTREYLDPVRFMTNASSGKMGSALAKEAYYRKAEVIVVTALPESLFSCGTAVIKVETALEMRRAVMDNIDGVDVFIGNAAVADFRFVRRLHRKIKKGSGGSSLEIEETPDILMEVAGLKKRPLTVGFALETDNHLANAVKKLKRKGADMLILNDAEAINSDGTRVVIINSKKGSIPVQIEKTAKENIAATVFDNIVKVL